MSDIEPRGIPSPTSDIYSPVLNVSSSPPAHPSVLSGLPCTPSRRSLKFSATWQARHFLAFDTAISRDERLLLFMELFVFRELLVDRNVVPAFTPATYTPEELLEVRVITDPRHPAYGQAGLFAKRAIPYNTVVTPYSGFIEIFATSCNSRTYTMGFGALGDDYALDAEFVGNYGRYANDPRGVGSLQANLSAENRFNVRGESFTALVARRQINAGEEILMSYGKAHHLSATPWVNVQGEAIMRPRLGGIIPFPSFRTSLPAGCAEGAHDAANAVGPRSSLPVPLPSSPCADRLRELHAKTRSAGDTTEERLEIANDLLWECMQCGMWMLCEASMTDAPLRCHACGTPKLSGARLLSLLSSPAITQADLLAEAGIDARGASPLSSPAEHPENVGETSVINGGVFSSERVDWPMNIPFLPWQVWDAAVPLMTLSKHARFETQEHVFVYRVDTGLGREKRERTVMHAGQDEEHSLTRRRLDTKADPSRHTGASSKTPTAHDSSGTEEDESIQEAEFLNESSSTSEGPTARRKRGVATRSGGQPKRNVLWELQGDPDTEELAALRSGMLALALPLLSPSASQTFSGLHSAVRQYSLETNGSARCGKDPHSPVDSHLPAADWRQTLEEELEALGAATGARSPLSFLLSTAQEVDRLIVLHRQGTRDTLSAATETPPHGSFSPQMTALRCRLQCMTRRLFTGKSFQAGEMVCHIGGLIRERGDTRCRVSESCLEIPLRFFLPPKWRVRRDDGHVDVQRTHGATVVTAPVHDTGNAQSSSPSPLPAASDSTVDGLDEEEQATLAFFINRMDNLSLVVTNEFMYCPCLALEQEEESAAETSEDAERVSGGAGSCYRRNSDVDEALAACNIALVMTLDSLGCPFACAIAIKPVGAFEPLLARAQ